MFINYGDKVVITSLDEYDQKQNPDLKIGMTGIKVKDPDGILDELFSDNLICVKINDKTYNLAVDQLEKVN